MDRFRDLRDLNNQILMYFPSEIRVYVEEMLIKYPQTLEEVRIRVTRPLSFLVDGMEIYGERKVIIDKDQLEKIFHIITNYSYYSVEQELQNGYITVPGGHRIGICGKAVVERGAIKTLIDINSLNFRLARQKIGVAEKVLPYLFNNKEFLSTIIISPPNCGKTTLLRDLIRNLAGDQRFNFKVGVVDERSELGGCYKGIPQLDLGYRSDIIDACPKKDGIIMMIRSMSPHIIATDELGKKDDVEALEYAITAGVKVLTTVHGKNLVDLKSKPYFDHILALKLFKRLVVMSNRNGMGTIEEIHNLENGKTVVGGIRYA